MFDVTFNTGRAYAARGQLIRAIECAGGAIFKDFDRCISGRVSFERVSDPLAFRAAVMREYDAGRYSFDFNASDIKE